MKVFFILLSVLSLLSCSQDIVSIDSEKVVLKDFTVEYYIDNANEVTFEDIESVPFIKGPSSQTLGAKITNTWVKIEVENKTKERKKLFLHQEFGYVFARIYFYEVASDGTLLQQKKINNYKKNSSDNMKGADAVYKFFLETEEKKIFYIRQSTHAYHFYRFMIFSEKESVEYLIFEKIDSVLFVGLLLALSIYTLLIYFTSGYKEYLYYSLYLLFASVWVFYIYGALGHYFHLYGAIAFRFNFAMMFIPFFLALFIQTIFETKTKYILEDKFLNLMKIVLFTNFLYGFINFPHAIQILALVLNYTLLTFLWISVSIYKKGNKIIKIFLVAHIFYFILNTYSILFYLGYVPYSYLSSHGIGIGIVIEALILSYLVSYKFKIAEEEKQASQILLFEKSKMADLGEIVENIAHQWRQPLATIAVSSAILEEKKLLNKLSDQDIEEELFHINSNIEYMSQTVEDFLSYFRPNKRKEDFCVKSAVEKAVFILERTLQRNKIEVSLDLHSDFIVFGFREEYIQVLITIISNAIHALEGKLEKVIKITSKLYENRIILDIEDNAGGVPSEIISKIFNPYFTTKNQNVGTGLGLYIAKNLIEESMQGSLEVKNIHNGALFRITI